MYILEHLTSVTDKLPPEDVDLFVCADPEDHEYEIARFYQKGSLIEEMGFSRAKDPVKRALEDLLGVNNYFKTAEETGFYILDSVGSEDGECHWRLLSYNPLDCSYAVICPEDE